MDKKIRLQKYLADSGVGSRRTCERYIQQGKISVNEKTIKELGTKINPNEDKIYFEGRLVKPQKKIWLMLNKPPKVICSSHDPKKRSSFLHFLPKDLGRVFAVGRLDYMSEGLLLITNDGRLANKISHPRYEILKKYKVKTVEQISTDQLKQMKKGIWDNGDLLQVLNIKKLDIKSAKNCYEIVLGEGKNRHIRRMLAALNIHIVYLKRIQVGPLKLGALKKGCWRFLEEKEIRKIENAVHK